MNIDWEELRRREILMVIVQSAIILLGIGAYFKAGASGSFGFSLISYLALVFGCILVTVLWGVIQIGKEEDQMQSVSIANIVLSFASVIALICVVSLSEEKMDDFVGVLFKYSAFFVGGAMVYDASLNCIDSFGANSV